MLLLVYTQMAKPVRSDTGNVSIPKFYIAALLVLELLCALRTAGTHITVASFLETLTLADNVGVVVNSLKLLILMLLGLDLHNFHGIRSARFYGLLFLFIALVIVRLCCETARWDVVRYKTLFLVSYGVLACYLSIFTLMDESVSCIL